jgi:hypothetical protein
MVSIQSNLQAQVTVIPHNYCGPGGILETTISKDQYGRTITTEKYFDGSNPRIMCEQVVTETKFDNSGTIETHTAYRKNGTVQSITIIEKNNDGSGKNEHKLIDENGNVSDGTLAIDVDGKTTYYKWDTLTKKFKGYDIVTSNTKKQNEKFACLPAFEFSVGYSYLSADVGNDRIGFPISGSIAGVFNFTERIGFLAHISFHNKKEESLKRSRICLLGGTRFLLRKPDNKVLPLINVMLGVQKEEMKIGDFKSKGSAFATGIGAGIQLMLKNKSFIRIKADALPTFWDNEDMAIDYRIGIEAGLGTRCKSSKLEKPLINLKSRPRE